jgi:hypothetical protein
MRKADPELTFLRELHRVLVSEGARSSDFYIIWSEAPPESSLAASTAWLKTLPSGVGEQKLGRLLRERADHGTAQHDAPGPWHFD